MAATVQQLRILCGDPSSSAILMTSQYSAIIEIESNVYRAAALACRSIAATFAPKVEMGAGPAKMKLQQKYEHYMDLAKKYDSRAESGGGSSSGLMPIRTGEDQEFFPVP